MGNDEPERIEVELTSHAPDEAPRRRRRFGRTPQSAGWAPPTDAAVVATDDASAAPDAPPGAVAVTAEGAPGHEPSAIERLMTERARTFVVAGAVGVVALLLGWMLGRSGGEDAGAAADTSPVTTERELSTIPEVFDDAEALPEADVDTLPSETEPVVTDAPTTIPPAEIRESVEIAPELRGLDLTLVGVSPDGRLVDLDLSTGTRRERRPERVSLQSDRIFAGRDWVALPAPNGRSGLRVIHDDGSESDIATADPWSVVHDGTAGTFWIDPNRGSGAREIDEVDAMGAPTGRSVTLPGGAWPLVADGGALVVQATGMLYRVTPDASALLARGELVGLSEDLVVAFQCDDTMACGMVVIDRATDARRAVPAAPDGDAVLAATGFVGPSAGTGVSPDGRWVTGVKYDSFGLEFGLLDLDTGEFVVLPGVQFMPSATWSPDGRFLIYLNSGQRLLAYDTTTGEALDVMVDDVTTWTALTARPTSVAVEEEVEG